MVTRLMESSHSSRITFYDESGAIIDHPVEGRKYGIAIDIGEESWSDLSLKLGAAPLPLRMDEEALFAHSELPPFGPGHYELSLVYGGVLERRTITVTPQHFTENDAKSMLHDLTDRLPKSIALLLQACGSLTGTNLALGEEATIEQEFFKLRRAMRGTSERLGILNVLPVLHRECHQVMVSKHELRSANQVRRPDISKLPTAMSMADNITSYGALKQMFEVTVEKSFETYENRLVKAYVQALQGQLSRLQVRLKSEQAPPAIVNEIDALASEFRLACTRAEFLRKVRIPLVSAARITMVLLKNPAYRSVLEDYVALHKHSSVRLEEPALSAKLNTFPFLYQLWANLTVISILLEFFAESGYRCVSHNLIKKDDQGFFIQFINDGEVALELSSPTTGTVVSVVPLRLDAGSKDKQELPPSTVVSIHTPNKPPVTLLFDPKYRVEEDAKQAVREKVAVKRASSKEANRTLDAIEPRREDIAKLCNFMTQIRKAKGAQQAQYGVILYPGLRKQITSDLEALTALPSNVEALKKDIYDVLRQYLA